MYMYPTNMTLDEVFVGSLETTRRKIYKNKIYVWNKFDMDSAFSENIPKYMHPII